MTGSRSEGFVEVSVPEAYERFMTRQLFAPWAHELVRRAAPLGGISVIDVATGPGTVARLAAAEVGDGGRVVACDVSAAMLAIAAAKPVVPDSARIEYLKCSAAALDAAEGTFRLALCQHGLQFFPDRLAALREIYRVLEKGGVALVSTWAAERPLGLFGPMGDTLRDCGTSEPYPRAFDAGSYVLGALDLVELLEAAGFLQVIVETVELECVWETSDDALATISGTPFAPVVAALPGAEQERIRAVLRQRLGCPADGSVSLKTASNIAHGVK